MNSAIDQLEKRLSELELLRRQRQTWLNNLALPMTERLHYLAVLRNDRSQHKNNVIRFPIERRFIS